MVCLPFLPSLSFHLHFHRFHDDVSNRYPIPRYFTLSIHFKIILIKLVEKSSVSLTQNASAPQQSSLQVPPFFLSSHPNYPAHRPFSFPDARNKKRMRKGKAKATTTDSDSDDEEEEEEEEEEDPSPMPPGPLSGPSQEI